MSSSNPTDDLALYATVEPIAREQGVDPELVMKIIRQESDGNPNAVGRLTRTGEHAQGLMQLMPEHFKTYGVTDPFDPVQSVTAGTKLLKELLTKYNGDQRLALVDYNGGPEAVAAYKAGTPYKETAGYLENILGKSDRPAPAPGADLEAYRQLHEPAAATNDLEAYRQEHEKPPTDVTGFVNGMSAALHAAMPNTYDAVVGGAKSLAKSVSDLSGFSQFAKDNNVEVAGQPVEKLLEPHGMVQKLAGLGEQAGEFAVPATGADALVTKLTGASSPVLRLLARSAAQAGVGAAVAKAHGENPVTGAEVAATGPVLGEAIGTAVPALLKMGARAVVKSALKTPVSLLNKGGIESAATKVNDVVDTVLRNRLSTADDAERFIQAQEAKLDVPIDQATAAGVTTEAPQMAQRYLREAADRLRGVGSAPTERMRAFTNEAEKILNDPNGSHAQDVLLPGGTSAGPITPAVPPTTTRVGNVVVRLPAQPAVQGPPVPNAPVLLRELRTNMTPRETLNSARAAVTNWNTMTPSEIAAAAAAKVTEVAERNALKKAVPETIPILEQQGHGIVAKKVLDRADVRHGNMDLVSLGLMASHGSPIGIAHQVLRASGVKGGILIDQLADAVSRNDVQLVTSLLTKMGYGAALEALPKEPTP